MSHGDILYVLSFMGMNGLAAFLKARDFLLTNRTDYATAHSGFSWPELDEFNWALDYFDTFASGNHETALLVLNDTGLETRLSFTEVAERSNRAANFLRSLGVQRGDHVLVMLGNEVELWETLLATFKLGAVVIPSTTLLTVEDLRDRLDRGEVRYIVAASLQTQKFASLPGRYTRIAVGETVKGWHSYDEAYSASERLVPDGPTRSIDPLLLYFTSGTTGKPKLVLHSHRSYPVGHLSTMYWIGLRPGDLHWNISSPGWAKHAWSCLFAPWNAGACVFAYNYARFQARAVLDVAGKYSITTLCAPPTVWRMLVQEKLADFPVRLREVVSAGEPLNPEVIEQVRAAWGLTVRDGYGQTETTALIGNSPGQLVKPGSMGRPLPGYKIELLDAGGNHSNEGDVSVVLSNRDYHRTGDIACRDEDGYIFFVGRADDVFKASDYRISPFELESLLVEHPAVAEAAVVPCPDPIRHAVPKAFIALCSGYSPSRELAHDIFNFLRHNAAPYKRVRRLEFSELPKTISGKIRRVELRESEQGRGEKPERRPLEFFEEDFSDA